jgi:catechol 2,3-dioxygenase-like lactoylglutathione lyase family enzyme
MIGYLTLGTNDLPRAARFYDDLLALLGAKRAMETERYIGWSSGPATTMLLLIKPHDGAAATVGNGTMVALAASSRDQVAAVHARALALGARDEGAVGPRGDAFFGGYFRDPDGNKLAVFTLG